MNALDRAIPLGRPFSVVVVVVILFVAAWLVSRFAERLAAVLVDRSERRRSGGGKSARTSLETLRQRETAIGLIATSVRYIAFGLAALGSLMALSGGQRLQTIVGASFLAIIVGFAVQRFLMDVVAGVLMVFEGWFRVGDTVAIDAWNAFGVVETVSLRALTLRTIQGEIVHVPNSQIVSLKVIPHGSRDVEVEFFASDLERGRELVEQIAPIVPVGPTRFLTRPELVDSETLAPDLHRITARCRLVVGRERLAEEFLPALIKERAADGLIAHGPIVTFVDEQAARSFARATERQEPAHESEHTWPSKARRRLRLSKRYEAADRDTKPPEEPAEAAS